MIGNIFNNINLGMLPDYFLAVSLFKKMTHFTIFNYLKSL